MTGSFCISIDLELAWGIWDKPSSEAHVRCAEREDRVVREVLARLAAHEMSATWAIVGRLLERDDRAAKTTKFGDRIWFAPSIVERIRRCPVAQDIGSHGYAHIYFGQSSREDLRADLQAARRVHDAHGLPFTSFVFPRNQVAHLDLLAEQGVRVFRSVDRGWFIRVREQAGTTAGRIANLVDKALPITPTPVAPITHPNMVELPSSMLLMARNGLRRAIHPAIVVAKARRGLDAASREGRIFHLWFHPSNFYYDTERQLDVLDAVLDLAAQRCRRGKLEVRPMSSYAS